MREYEEDIQYNEKALSKPLQVGLVLKRTPFPDLIISRNHLNELRKDTYELFCDWVLDNNKLVETEDDFKIVKRSTLVKRYETIEKWADAEFYGHWPDQKSFEGIIYQMCCDMATRTLSEDVPYEEIDAWRETDMEDWTKGRLEDVFNAFCRSITTAEAWDLGHKFAEEQRIR